MATVWLDQLRQPENISMASQRQKISNGTFLTFGTISRNASIKLIVQLLNFPIFFCIHVASIREVISKRKTVCFFAVRTPLLYLFEHIFRGQNIHVTG
jgi:hypothetical protein